MVDWWVARRIYDTDIQRRRRALLGVSLAVNLGMLGYFKYGGFLLENWAGLMSAVGVTWTAPGWDIVLPVGISFYTFQTLAYSLDVYLRRAKPADSLLDFALFVTFFPQLVAGPIVRPTQLIPQFQAPVRANRSQLLWGLGLMTLGLFEKIVIADGALAPAADAVFGADKAVPFTDAWLGTLAFAGQIFSDFAGYSTVAIGVALCLGFSLPDNFRFPVRRDRVLRLLAPVAHLALDLAARLPVHPARRQPEGVAPDPAQPDDHDAARWPVARRRVDVRGLGRPARVLPRRRTVSAEALRGRDDRPDARLQVRARAAHLFSRQPDLGVLPVPGTSAPRGA